MIAHFFDINSLITTNAKIWVVSKIKPSIPIIKIDQSEFNLIKKGVYRKFNQQFTIGNKSYWLSDNIINDVKIKCKKIGVDITDLSFSMQEFMNPNIIEKLDYKICTENFEHLKNTNDDIYVICSKNSKKNYEVIIKKLEEMLKDIGLVIKNYYYLSETFYNRDKDDVSQKKAKLLIQHSIGLKTEIDKFTNEEITQYDEVNLYDDENNCIEVCKGSNEIIRFLVSNSPENIKDSVKSIIKDKDLVININLVTFNKINKFVTTSIKIEWQNVIKTFEGFRYKG
jgi:hypothetical protein